MKNAGVQRTNVVNVPAVALTLGTYLWKSIAYRRCACGCDYCRGGLVPPSPNANVHVHAFAVGAGLSRPPRRTHRCNAIRSQTESGRENPAPTEFGRITMRPYDLGAGRTHRSRPYDSQ